MLSEGVLYLPIRELAGKIRSRQISSVELTQSYLERSQRLGPRLNAYALLLPELAMEQARAAESEIAAGKYRGPLHGIPYAAKDLLSVAGYPTGWGARPYSGQKFDFDATVIRRLREAGAVLLGKSAMIELAGGMGYRYASASVSGAAKNPWNESCWTCGSSSGSAAIVSAAMAAFAIGTETWGSIICPSSFTGISGLRPTYGRVSRHGAMALSYSMDKIGPMGRTADDCAIVLAYIAGHDPLDPASLPAGDAEFHPGLPLPGLPVTGAAAVHAAPGRGHRRPADVPTSGAAAPRVSDARIISPKQIRVGWLNNAWKSVPADIAESLTQARAVLGEHVAGIDVAALPEGPWETAAGIVISVEGAAAFESLIDSGKVDELADPLGRIGGYINQQIPSSDFVRAMRIRGVLQKKMNHLFDRYDVLVAASLPVTASPLDTNLETGLSFADPLGGIGNFCGLPAVSVPCGWSNKLPVGIQFVGRPLNDAVVVVAANAFQENTDWHRQRPSLG